MLIAVPPDCADEFVARLRNHGSPRTAIVGEVMPRKTASEIELVG
jgi:hydrogenase maturation factor